MCGIFAYTGHQNVVNTLLNGLQNLEYRGYDSAGLIAVDKKGKTQYLKSLGKVSNLASQVEGKKQDFSNYHTGIAHTRWATHGGVTLENTHPHHSQDKRFYLVHNGIIENYKTLKKDLEAKGYTFYGDTDSEIVANLIQDTFTKDLQTTLQNLTSLITGAYALVVIDTQNPDEIIALKLGSPLVLGIKKDELYLSSDPNALAGITDSYIPIDDHEMVVISKNTYKILSSQKEIKKQHIQSQEAIGENVLENFDHFMEKEIFEVPQVIENILGGRIDFKTYQITSNSLNKLDVSQIHKIEFVASGTSYNAGAIGVTLFEELANIPASVSVSSEFKYKKQFISPNTLYIFLSQSGETADSLECLKMVKNKGGQTFGVVNVVGSSIARLCENGLYTHCGVEIGVAATKTFIGQLLTLLIIALYMGNKSGLEYRKYKKILTGLSTLKDEISMVLLGNAKIQKISKKYAKYPNMFFLGRNMFYPVAMEGSLKCKEITYHHCESYPSGELKHGPLSLIDKNFPTLLINPASDLYEKNFSTLQEIQARNGKVIGLLSKNDSQASHYDDILEIPESNTYNSLFSASVVLQLFAYYMAKHLGKEIDKPRNLAKSVTVE